MFNVQWASFQNPVNTAENSIQPEENKKIRLPRMHTLRLLIRHEI